MFYGSLTNRLTIYLADNLFEYNEILCYSYLIFVFTTHNLGPMEVLQKEKMSTDFLSNDSRIAPWVKTDNNSAVSVYRRGLIKYSPFNIEPFNFLGVFDNKSANRIILICVETAKDAKTDSI